MLINSKKKNSMFMNTMRFSDGGAQPAPEPNPEPAPAPAPEPNPEPAPAPAPDISEIQRQLDAYKRAKEVAEKALDLEKSAHSKLKRQHMSEADILAEKTREMEEKAKMYDRQANAFSAEKIFVNAGLKADDYEELLDLIVNEDSEKTERAAQAISDLLAWQRQATEKSIREKVLKEMPTPPGGEQLKQERTLEDELKSMLFRQK